MALVQVGTIDPYLHAAMSPNGDTLYVNHDSSAIVAYSYPGLVAGATVASPARASGEIEGVACDDAGVLYWWENSNGSGMELYKSTQAMPFYSTVDEQAPVGLCWYDGLLYGFGMTNVADGESLCSWNPAVAGGDRTVLYTPSLTQDDLKFVNNPVPALDGTIWWSYPDIDGSSTIHRYDIASASGADTGFHLDDMFIPRPGNAEVYDYDLDDPETFPVWAYGTPTSGGVGAAGYVFWFDASFDWPLTILDSFSPGPRAVAYTPDLLTVAFERGSSGEVWTIGDTAARWSVGFIGWRG